MPELVDESNGLIYHLDHGKGDIVTIGKGDDCSLIVPPPESRSEYLHEEPPYSAYDYVSRKHSAYAKKTKVLSDLGSTNGTFVNDDRISQEGVALKSGDRIRLGRLELTFFDGV